MDEDMIRLLFLSKPGEGDMLMSAGLRLQVGTTQTGGSLEVAEL